MEDYYEKRKNQSIEEAVAYAKAIREREHREPTIFDFRPEFGLFVDSHNIDHYDVAPIKLRLGEKYDYWLENHKAPFDGFEDSLEKTKNNI